MATSGNLAARERDGNARVAIEGCRALFATGFRSGVYPQAVFRAILTTILIDLNDLLRMMNNEGHRLEWKHDIWPEWPAADITELVSNARNAACHTTSGHRVANRGGKVVFCVFWPGPERISINGIPMWCPYPNDFLVVWGSNPVYANRHLLRALGDAEAYFAATATTRDE